MERRLNSIIDPLLTPDRARWVFIIGIFLFAVLGNAIYETLFEWLGSPVTIGLLAFLGLLIVLLANEVRKRLWRRRLVSLGIQPRVGLIVPVSQGVYKGSATEAAIQYHYRGKDDVERPVGILRHCWLLTSPDVPSKDPEGKVPQPPNEAVSAWVNADYVTKKYEGQIDCHIIQIDPNDPEDVFEKVENSLKEAERRGLKHDEVAINFKPGTKEITVGTVLAATASGYNVETMLPSKRDADGYRLAGSTSEFVMFDLRPKLDIDPD